MSILPFLILILLGCGAQPLVIREPSLVPLSIWHLPTDGCSAWWARPAMLCQYGVRPEMADGCHWTCDGEPRQ